MLPIFHWRAFGQTINSIMRSSLDQLLSLFDSEDLTHVLAFEEALANCRLTHKLLCERLDLDRFQEMLQGESQADK